MEACGKELGPKIGCITKSPVKDVLIPGRKFLSVYPTKLNSDDLVDLVIEGDGGSGGNQVYVFFQETTGVYQLKGMSFAHTTYLEPRVDQPASLIFVSQAGICNQHFERVDFENDHYEPKAEFNWKCVSETESKPKYKVELTRGTWSDPRIKDGYQGERVELFSMAPASQINFVQVDAKLRLKMKD